MTTFKISKRILDGAIYDHDVSVRVVGVSDMIAAEGKYHPNCYKRFLNKAQKIHAKSDILMIWLCRELENAAQLGHVVDLTEVRTRYCTLAEEAGTEIPPSFISRLATFKDKLKPHIYDIYEFIVLRDQAVHERKTILVPLNFIHIPLSKLIEDQDDNNDMPIPLFNPKQDNDFLSMVHVALELRPDILCHPPYREVNVSEEESLACVPDMLYMFLNLLLGGQDLLDKSDLDDDIEETDHASKSDHAPNSNKQEQHKHMRVLSIGQDIVYSVNGGKVWTPKHVGLGSSLHQATRSRQLIELFHEAGHTVSYRDVLRLDTAIAKTH